MKLNPNLFISIDIEDVESQLKMIGYLYGSDLSEDEISSIHLKIQRIIWIFNCLGVDYDSNRINKVIHEFDLMDKETDSLWAELVEGSLLDYLFSSGNDPLDEFSRLLNNITKEYLQKIKKIIGTKDFDATYSKGYEMVDPQLLKQSLSDFFALIEGGNYEQKTYEALEHDQAH